MEVIKKAYMQGEVGFEDGENGEEGAASPRNVGHNIYILAHQVLPLPGPPATCHKSEQDVPFPWLSMRLVCAHDHEAPRYQGGLTR